MTLHNSPWGRPDHQEEVAPGIIQVDTPSHGGYWLSPERMKQMAERMPEFVGLNTYGGKNWFEEDQEWSLVVLTFPECFDSGRYGYALRILWQSYPKAYAVCFPIFRAEGECECCGGAGYYPDDRWHWKPERICERCFPKPPVPCGTESVI